MQEKRPSFSELGRLCVIGSAGRAGTAPIGARRDVTVGRPARLIIITVIIVVCFGSVRRPDSAPWLPGRRQCRPDEATLKNGPLRGEMRQRLRCGSGGVVSRRDGQGGVARVTGATALVVCRSR